MKTRRVIIDVDQSVKSITQGTGKIEITSIPTQNESRILKMWTLRSMMCKNKKNYVIRFLISIPQMFAPDLQFLLLLLGQQIKTLMKINIYLSLAVAAAAIISSCSGENNEESNKSDIVKKAKIEVDTTDVYTSEEYDFMLPQPFALVSSFERVDLDYDVTSMNDPANVDNYNSEGKKLLNFGVYSTDLVFSIVNDKPQESMNYFNAVKEMADKIGMGSIFTEESLADSIEKNIANREKMEYLLIDVHERSQDYLENNEMRVLAAIQFAGAWTEGMYLATRAIPSDDMDTYRAAVADHMSLAKNAIEGIEAYKEREEDLNMILENLKSIKEKYDNFDAVQNAKGLPELTEENLIVLQKEFDKLRTSITQ